MGLAIPCTERGGVCRFLLSHLPESQTSLDAGPPNWPCRAQIPTLEMWGLFFIGRLVADSCASRLIAALRSQCWSWPDREDCIRFCEERLAKLRAWAATQPSIVSRWDALPGS